MGLSPRNLWNMKRFYLRYYQEDIKVQRSVALLPWRHNLLLLGHDLSSEHVIFYANEILNKGWSKDMLYLALKSEYHLSLQASERSNNFAFTMSNENAEYANEIFRSRYHLGFIDAVEPLKELDLERHLVNKITSFIMELGIVLVLSATNARQKAVRSVDFCRVRMYWDIGKRIFEEEQEGKDRADYGSYLIKNLADKLIPEYGSGFSVR